MIYFYKFALLTVLNFLEPGNNKIKILQCRRLFNSLNILFENGILKNEKFYKFTFMASFLIYEDNDET